MMASWQLSIMLHNAIEEKICLNFFSSKVQKNCGLQLFSCILQTSCVGYYTSKPAGKVCYCLSMCIFFMTRELPVIMVLLCHFFRLWLAKNLIWNWHCSAEMGCSVGFEILQGCYKFNKQNWNVEMQPFAFTAKGWSLAF